MIRRELRETCRGSGRAGLLAVFDQAPGPPDTPFSPMIRWTPPTPEQAEEVEGLLRALPEDLRQIVLWALAGETNREIAVRIGRTERTVELKRQQIRARLERLVAPGG